MCKLAPKKGEAVKIESGKPMSVRDMLLSQPTSPTRRKLPPEPGRLPDRLPVPTEDKADSAD